MFEEKKEALIDYLTCPSKRFEELQKAAVAKRNSSLGNKIYLRASIEVGNICKNKCKYCGMSCENETIRRYRMDIAEMKEVIDQICETNIKQLHLVSGEEEETLEDYIESIKYAKRKGLSVTSVFGIRTVDEYKRILDAGASRYIMKFETSNSKLFEQIKPGNLYDDRITNIKILKKIGFKVGTGTIVGLPGTNIDDIVNDLFLLKELNPDMASSSVFSPNKQSAFAKEPAGSNEITLRVISLMRLLLKDDVYIPSSSSLGFKGQIDAINHGANVISVHFTPEKYSDLFSMYKSSNRIKRELEEISRIAQCVGAEIGEYT